MLSAQLADLAEHIGVEGFAAIEPTNLPLATVKFDLETW